MVLNNLGMENTALGFLAGFTGDKLKEMLEEKGIRTEFLPIRKGMTRINVKTSLFVANSLENADALPVNTPIRNAFS